MDLQMYRRENNTNFIWHIILGFFSLAIESKLEAMSQTLNLKSKQRSRKQNTNSAYVAESVWSREN